MPTAIFPRTAGNALSCLGYALGALCVADTKPRQNIDEAMRRRLSSLASLEGLEEENRRLRRLLDLKNSVGAGVVSAQVMSKNTNTFFRVARIG